MARFGINPARGKNSDYHPARVTVAVITYIPHLDGYFKHRLEILQLAIASLLANTTGPYDLLVFDNGSTSQVTQYLQGLQARGDIQYLFLSRENIGKIGAFSLLFNAAPGEFVAYTDDDIYFYPGWIEALMEVFEAFPQAGMVSGAPIRDASERASKSLSKLIKENDPKIKVTRERRVPDEWEMDWAISVGRDPQAHLENTRDYRDLILERNGVEVFGSASHFQFLAPREAIIKALPKHWSGKLMGEMNELDQAVDDLGYLRLSTVDRYTRHMGNTISPEMLKTAQQLGVSIGTSNQDVRRKKHWLLSIPGSGRLLRRIYNYLFKVLHNID